MKMIFPDREFKGIRKGFILVIAFDLGAALLIVDLFSPYALRYALKRDIVELPFGGDLLSGCIHLLVLILPLVLIVLSAALFFFSRERSFVRAHRAAIFTALWGAAFLLSVWFYYANTFYVYPLNLNDFTDENDFFRLSPAKISPPKAVLWAQWLKTCLDKALAFYLWPAYIGLVFLVFRWLRRRYKRQGFMYYMRAFTRRKKLP